jgi:hypothetical protein
MFAAGGIISAPSGCFEAREEGGQAGALWGEG